MEAVDFKRFRKLNNLKQKDIADYLGVTRSFVSQVESGSSPLPDDKLEKILTNEKGWDISMLSSRTGMDLPQRGIPLLPVAAVAGYMSGNSRAVMEYECEWFDIPAFHGADFLMHVAGDSMIPRYLSGDIIACRRVLDRSFFQWNRAYVIDTMQGVLIKRVRPGKDDGHITLVSENENYSPFEISVDDILSLSIVVGLVRAE